MIFKFDIEPIGKARPRASRRGKHIHMYTPNKTQHWMQLVFMKAREQYKGPPLGGPMEVHIISVFKRPQRIKIPERTPHVVKPDIDNVAKIVLDALCYGENPVLVDDKLIYKLNCESWYAAEGEEPSVTVKVVQ